MSYVQRLKEANKALKQQCSELENKAEAKLGKDIQEVNKQIQIKIKELRLLRNFCAVTNNHAHAISMRSGNSPVETSLLHLEAYNKHLLQRKSEEQKLSQQINTQVAENEQKRLILGVSKLEL